MTKHWFELGATLHEAPTPNETPEETQAKLAFINLLEYLAEEGECPVSTLEGALTLPPPMKLNEGQQKALDKWVQFLKTDKVVFKLQGPAGTGKTYVARRLLKASGYQPHQMKILAPTHAARKLHGSDAITVAKALGMRPLPGDKGQMLFSNRDEKGRKREDPLAGVKIFLLDEAGMVSEDQMLELIAKVKENNGKLIVMGDEYQLPPVTKDDRITSPAFDMAEDGAVLTQSMRNQGLVLQYASGLRDAMKQVTEQAEQVGVKLDAKTPVTINQLAPDEKEVIQLPSREWMREAVEFFRTNQDPTAGRVLFYTNHKVSEFNKFCQQELYGTQNWQIGQKVVCYKPVTRLELKKVKDYWVVETVIHADNSEVVEITGTPIITTYNKAGLWEEEQELTRRLFGDIEITLVDGLTESGVQVQLRVPTDKGNDQISDVTGSWKGGKKVKGTIDQFWDARDGKGTMPAIFEGMDYGDIKNARYQAENICFDYAQPYWASTVHKAQGCTVAEKLFVHIPDCLLPVKHKKSFLAAKLLYTAVTRAGANCKVYIPRV